MTIIQIPQGYWNSLDGVPKEQALGAFVKHDAEFLLRHPQCAPYHRPSWVEMDVPDHRTAPWGHEWYQVMGDGLLKMHSADYDSSD